MRALTLMAAALAAAIAVPAGAQSVKAGVEAWQQGDFGHATAIWRVLADKGDADAAFNLGQAYRLGRGVNASSADAAAWFEKAAKRNHLDAQVSLGLLLFDSGDRVKALQWLGLAAERSEPRAMLVVGTALFNGDGLPRDPIKGYAYVSHAAAQGLQPAKSTLAEMDKVMPAAERQKGVAIALDKVRAGKPTAAKTTSAPAKVAEKKAEPSAPAPAKVAAAIPTKPTVAMAKGGGWRIQLGAFSNRGAAQGLFGKLSSKLGGAQAYYVPVGSVTRLQVGPYASRADASAACARLKPQACFPVAAN